MFRFLASTFLLGVLSILAFLGLAELARKGRDGPLRLDQEIVTATQEVKGLVARASGECPSTTAPAEPVPTPSARVSPAPSPVPAAAAPVVASSPAAAEPVPQGEIVNRDAWSGGATTHLSTTVRTNIYLIPTEKADWRSIAETIRSAQDVLTR